MEHVVFTLCFTVFYVFHMTLLHPPPTPPSVNNNETFNVTPSSNQATSSRIQHHPTHFTWRYYTPPPPHPPFCKQQRNFQRNTIFQPSNIFQDSRSSNALHMTLLHTPPPPPPHPPSLYKNDLYGIASRLRVPRSSGEPPALSLYIHHIIFMLHPTRSPSKCFAFYPIFRIIWCQNHLI